MGFYQGKGETLEGDLDFRELDDEALAQQFFEAWGDLASDANEPSHAHPDLPLLWSDTERVWQRDLECRALEGNRAYVRALGEWAHLSRGKLVLEAVEEAWEPADPDDSRATDPTTLASDFVTVSMVVEGRRHAFRIPHLNDFLNPGILAHLNALIASSGLQYYRFRESDSTIAALTEVEHGRIIGERGLNPERINSAKL